jgi:hypothetical protein
MHVFHASRADRSSILFKTKKQLRKMGSKYLPASYLSKRKQGFYAPVRDVVAKLAGDYLNTHRTVVAHYFKTKELDALFAADRVHYKAKFNLLVLLIWMVQNNETIEL